VSVPASVLDEIRARVDLVELISAVVPLKRAGERWKGLCPFHREKTPSFTVSPKLNLFHCFGCHAGGDAIEFLKRHDRLEFMEAVRLLSERTGVPLPERGGPAAAVRDGLHALTEWAGRRFEAWLWERDDADRARRYLAERGLSEATARRFHLGYAPEGWDHLLGAARAEGYGPEALLGAGLVLPRQTGGGHYDRFRGRLIFPITDSQGRAIAFGGRALGAEEPKYLNSPETALYSKGQTLYALHQARDAMSTTRRALLVEGYIDCLMAHQSGLGETVAVLGTALTPHHLGLLRRYVDEVVLFFDADRAGAEAARRAEDLLEQSADPYWWSLSRRPEALQRGGVRLRVATLPAGHDPDTFLRQEGREAFDACCQAARPLLRYALDRALGEEDTATLRGRATSVARVALLLSKVQDGDEAIDLGREAARQLGVDASDLWLQAQRLSERTRPAAPPASPAATPATLPTFERDLLQFLLQVPAGRPALLPELEPREVAHPVLRAILEALQVAPGAPAGALVERLEDPAGRALLTRLLVEERAWPESAVQTADFAQRLTQRRRVRRVRELSRAIARAEAEGTPDLDTLPVTLLQEARRSRVTPDSPSTEDPLP
jgi:DNA primase